MSDDPADIYITRDQFAQGQQRGRLVCAIFVDQPSFVEITVHPEDWDPVVPEAPTPAPTPLASGFIEILTHCGLHDVRIEYDGGLWRFDVEPDGNPPPGWGFNTTVVELVPGASGPVVIGPDGSRWPLIRAERDPSSGGCL